MEQHPEINDPVVLRDDAGRELASRVEDRAEGLLIVEQPPDLPAEATFGNGTDVRVAWADANGDITVLPTRMLGAHVTGTLQVWSLAVTGPPSMAQRRRFERVATAGPVALRSAEGADTEAVTGRLVDVSERAIRCSVATGSADRFLGARNEVIAAFTLGTAEFAVPGRVEFARGTKRPTELEELVVVFDEPVAEAEALRKHLFAEEVRTPRNRVTRDR